MLLEVRHLTTQFHSRMGLQTAVDDVSFCVDAGQTLAIVGESGSGKSVCCYSLLGLIPQPPGKIAGGTALFQGLDLLAASERQLRAIRGGDIAFIFQDPMTSLNPFLTIGEQLLEPLMRHRGLSRSAARQRALAVLEEVGIEAGEQRFNHYPHHFSGGMRQRLMIAMALIVEPKLLIADEPTTALDVTVQAQILALLASLQRRYGIAVIFISHDLSVVASIADQILVMQEGVVVERGSVEDIFQRPQQAYTRQLLEAIPRGAKAQAAKVTEQAAPLLQVEDLKTHFRPVSSGLLGLLRPPADPVKAVDGVSFTIERGDIVGLVGESGSGKSTLGRSLLRLLPVTAGAVHFDGLPLGALAPAALRAQRRHMQMIFQDPYASLNPRMTVAQTLAEPLIYHRLATSQQVHQQVFALMDEVGLVRGSSGKYPHEFSGGQRQRIAIARAIASKPAFIVADEPVSALDVSIQAQILALLLELVASHGLTMLFISHDLSVVRQLCDRVMVMHRGKIVEQGLTEQLYSAPQDRYTQALLAAASAPP